MNGWLDGMLVAGVSCAAFVYAICSLGPRSLRARLLTGVAWLLRRLPAPGLGAAAERVAAAAARNKAACGGCDNCGSDKSSATPDLKSEVKIPLSHVGRRR